MVPTIRPEAKEAELEYKFEMIYEQDDFIGFMRAVQKRTALLRITGKITNIGLKLAAGFLVLAGCMNIVAFIREPLAGEDAFPAVFFVTPVMFIIIGSLLLVRSSSRLSGKITWKRYREKGSKVTYCFCDDCFMEYTAVSEHRFQYSVIHAIYEDRKRYYLFVDKL